MRFDSRGTGSNRYRPMLAAVVFAAWSFFPAAAFAQTNCRALSGDDRRQCERQQNLDRVAANRAAADAAKRERQGTAAPSDAPTQANVGPGKTILLNASGRPVVTHDGSRSNLTIITHSGYNGREIRYTIPVTRGCGPDPVSRTSLTYERACHDYILENYKAAEPVFKQACDEGDPSGCFMTAQAMGGVSSNRPEVLAMVKTACEDGQAQACYILAEAYRLGKGVAKDPVQVKAYYQQACAVGQEYSCAWLAGKIDPNCPHGMKVYAADLDKNTYKVLCRTPGPVNFSEPEEHEIPASPSEIDWMKKYAEQTRNAPTVSLTKLVSDALQSSGSSGSGSGGGRFDQSQWNRSVGLNSNGTMPGN